METEMKREENGGTPFDGPPVGLIFSGKHNGIPFTIKGYFRKSTYQKVIRDKNSGNLCNIETLCIKLLSDRDVRKTDKFSELDIVMDSSAQTLDTSKQSASNH